MADASTNLASSSLLPSEHPPTHRRARPLLTVVLTLALVLVLNFASGVLLRHVSPNRGYRIIERKWAMLESMTRPAETLILGDSTVNQGLDTRLIRAHYGDAEGATVNLATIGHMMLLNDAWMLERHIQRLGPPKRVILGHVYDIFQRRARTRHFLLVPAVPTVGDWTVSPPIKMTTRDRALLATDRLFPMYAQNDSLTTLVREPSTLLKELRTPEPDAALAGFEPNPGPASVEFVAKNARAHLGAIKRYPGKLSDENRAALEHMCALAERHDFDIYLAVSPVYDAFEADPIFKRFFMPVREDLRAMDAKYERLHLVMDWPLAFPARDMDSVDHVLHTGAERYTRELLKAIARHHANEVPEAAKSSQ